MDQRHNVKRQDHCFFDKITRVQIGISFELYSYTSVLTKWSLILVIFFYAILESVLSLCFMLSMISYSRLVMKQGRAEKSSKTSCS